MVDAAKSKKPAKPKKEIGKADLLPWDEAFKKCSRCNGDAENSPPTIYPANLFVCPECGDVEYELLSPDWRVKYRKWLGEVQLELF